MSKIIARIIGVVAVVAFCRFQQPAFVPVPAGRPLRNAVPISAAVGAATMLGAAPAFAGNPAVDDAAKKFAAMSYPIAQQIDWINIPTLMKYMTTGTGANKQAIIALLDCGLFMDQNLIEASVIAHKKAIDAANGKMVTPLANYEDVTVSIANLLASVPFQKVYGLYGAMPALDKLNGDFFATVNAAAATESYTAFLATAQAVKAAGSVGR